MSKNILVVEDDNDIREVIGMLLDLERYEVELCEDTECLRTKIAQQKPDLIILDVMLPDGNGCDLCCEVKNDSETSNVPIMMMSANFDLEKIKQYCDPDEFIQKPFDIDVFLDKVAGLIKKSSRDRIS